MSGLFRRPPQPHQRSRFQTQPPSVTATGAGTQAQASGVYVNAVRTDSPVAYYRMGEASGEVVDSAGSAHGTTTGTVTRDATGLLSAGDDGAISFATSAYISGTLGAAIGNVFTLEAWVKLPASGTSFITYFSSKGSASNIAIGVARSASAGSNFCVTGYVYDGSTYDIVVRTPDSVMVAGGTYHVVWTRAGTTLANNVVYINGSAQTNTAGVTQAVVNTDTTFYISGFEGTAETWVSTIDEVALYNTALSGASVLAHYNAAQPTGAGLETFEATGAGTQAAQTATGDGTSVVDVTGTGAATQTTQSGSGTGEETFSGTGAGTQAAQSATGDGIETIATGTGAGTQVAQSGSGTGEAAEPSTTGTGAGTQAAQSGSGSGLETISGTGAGTGTAASGSGSATETFTGTGAGTQAAQTGAGSGNSLVAVTGTGAGTQAAQTAEGSGLQIQAVSGTGAGTQQPATASGTGIGGESVPVEPGHGHGAILGQRAKVVGPAQPQIVQLLPVKGTGHGEQAAASAYGTGFVNDDELVLLLLEAA